MFVIKIIYMQIYKMRSFYFFNYYYFFFRAAPTAYGSSQARGQIGATASGLCHSNSNTRSKPYL